MNQPINQASSWTEIFKLFLKGFCMGIAEIIPGISGGTIAFILGIYQEFIESIKSFNLVFVKLLLQFKIKEALSVIHWKFLTILVGGMFSAILILAKLISWMLYNKPHLIYSFFFGLILATIPAIAEIVKKWTPQKFLWAAVVSVLTFFLVAMVPVVTPNTPWFICLSGMIAISAMILPGISGSFLLVLLGKYHTILEALNHHDFVTIGFFVLGIAIGIVCFVRVLSWLFEHYHDVTIVTLIGLVIGSLNKIWPWKVTLQTMTSSKGKIIPTVQSNFFPGLSETDLGLTIAVMVLGFLIAYCLNRFSSTKPQIT